MRQEGILIVCLRPSEGSSTKKAQPPHTAATAAAAHNDFGVANRFNLRQMCGTPGEVVALV